ncbi:MAG: MFS transporter [Gorillibacterium sp.]|nr:MFS transporter [Gorillibacterium sp.]
MKIPATDLSNDTHTQQPVSPNAEKLLKVMLFTLIISVMNGTVFNLVLPDIAKEFTLTTSQVGWVVSSYMLVYAIGAATYGKLADKYKLKNLITFGLIFFALGAIIGLTANSFAVLILGRVLQAIGSSVIPATAMIVPVRYFPPHTRGRALGSNAIGIAIGSAVGPIVCALIMSVASWRFLFLLSLVPLVIIPFFRKYLDDEPGTTARTDLPGGILLAGTVALLLLSITNSNLNLFMAGAVLFAGFILWISKVKDPFVQPSLFRNKNYSISLAIAFVINGLSFSLPYLSPQLLTHVNKLDSSVVGYVMVPAALCSALLGRRGGRLADEKGSLFLIYMSTGLQFLCYLLLSTLVGQSALLIAAVLILGFVGQTFTSIGLSKTISHSLSRENTGVGMGLFSLVNFISTATSTALLSKFLDGGSSFVLNPFPTNSTAFVYSNIYLSLALILVVVILIYSLLLRPSPAKKKRLAAS